MKNLDTLRSEETPKPITDGEIDLLKDVWLSMDDTHFAESFIYDLEDIKEAKKYLDYLSRHKVLELGPGRNPITKFIECGEYVGVQPFECSSKDTHCKDYIINDALSYLRTEKDHSAIIVSFGMIDIDVLAPNDAFSSSLSDLNARYISELTKEILRVSGRFAIICGSRATNLMGKEPDIYVRKDIPSKGGIYNTQIHSLSERGVGDFYEESGLVGHYANEFVHINNTIKRHKRKGTYPSFEGIPPVELYMDLFLNVSKLDLELIVTDKSKPNIDKITELGGKANEIIKSKDISRLEELEMLIVQMEDVLVNGITK